MYKLYASRMCTLVSGIRVHWSIVKEKSSACKRRSHYLSNRLKLTFLWGENDRRNKFGCQEQMEDVWEC